MWVYSKQCRGNAAQAKVLFCPSPQWFAMPPGNPLFAGPYQNIIGCGMGDCSWNWQNLESCLSPLAGHVWLQPNVRFKTGQQ